MKIKYLILKSNGGQAHWNYMGKVRDLYQKSITSSHFLDRFLCIDVKDVQQFDSYEEAEGFISKLGIDKFNF